MRSVTFCPSEARTCGDCTSLVLLSLAMACSKAPGRVVEKSPQFTCPMWLSGIVVLVVVVVPVVLLVLDEAGEEIELRGEKPIGRDKPVLPPELSAAAMSFVRSA